jgi:hypothetical protein
MLTQGLCTILPERAERASAAPKNDRDQKCLGGTLMATPSGGAMERNFRFSSSGFTEVSGPSEVCADELARRMKSERWVRYLWSVMGRYYRKRLPYG